MGDDVDTLLALMGGDAPPPPRVAAASVRQKLRAGRAGPPGRQDLPEQQASELWNPTVRWNPGAAVAPAAPLRRPSVHVELARQKAVRSLQARFKAQCDALNTGWSEPEVNKNFECWMLDSSIRRPTDGGGGGGGGGNNDPLLPPPKTAGEDPGLRKALFASAKLQRKTAFRFCSDMQKAVSKAHRTLAQLAATGGGQNRTVRVNPATVPAAESAQQWQREHEQKQQPMLGWDGKAMLQIRYGSTSVLVNQCHWDKLATMLRLELGEEAAAEPAESGLFKERVLCLLIRYNSLQGGGVHGGGFQAAIPDRVFDSLLRHFDVCFECFASPLNSRYPHFCSAFPDTDAPFGSVGSFFNFEPREGCFEANPPFVPNLMLKMAEHMHTLLVRADGDAEDDGLGEQPLCFIVIIPSWDTAMGWRALNESPFLSHHLRLGQKEHGYTEGAQHCRRSRYRISVGDTSVFFLQSKAAARKWPVSAEALADVEDSFSSKHNNDSSDSTSHETGGGGSGDEAASGDDDADSGGDVDDSGGGGSSSGRQPGGTTQEEEEEEEEESGQHENDEQLEDEDQGSEKGKQAKVMRKRKRAQVAASETAQQAVLGGGDGGSGGTVGAPGTAERQTKKKKEGRSKKEKREKIAQEETQKKKKKKQNKQKKKKKKRRGSGIAVVTT